MLLSSGFWWPRRLSLARTTYLSGTQNVSSSHCVADTGVPLQPEPCQQRQAVMDAPDQKQSMLDRLLRREAPVTGGC